jgi:NAD(P)-dependent dehydrogenase (short-subunit alcohol dehydrogenase family)
MFLNLAEEVRPHNIAVNVLDPGRVDTWMNRNGDWPGTAHIPMAQPDVMIPAAVWLAQQTAATWTGQVVKRAEFGCLGVAEPRASKRRWELQAGSQADDVDWAETEAMRA